MIPRLLVPLNAQPPAADAAASSRRRPTSLDERTLVPAMLPIVQLDGRTSIPASLPLDAVAARTLVPRDLKAEAYAVAEDESAPVQPTELDERIAIPRDAAPLEITAPQSPPLDMVEADIFMTGEVNLLNKPDSPEKSRAEAINRISSVAVHILVIVFLIFEPKIFPPRQRSAEEEELARHQISIFLPPGALDAPKTAPRPKIPTSEAMRVDPRVLRRIAPPEPQPTPGPKEPERVVKDLPSAPTPQPNATPPTPQPNSQAAKSDAPKAPLKLEAPQEQTSEHALLLPKDAGGGSLRNSIREASKLNAPSASLGGGGQLPPSAPGGGGQGAAYGAMTLLTPTEGVDFSNYLARVYASVKQNWFAVMPASVSLGDKGVVVLRFRIFKNGSVPTGEPLRVRGSGKEPLDRAAISSIRASNPFEPLPTAFKGDFIELQFAYYYNLQPDYTQ